MHKSAIRLLTIAMFAVASAAVPVTTAAKAATDGTVVKKKHKKTSSAGTEAQTPKTSSQYPPNMSDDPSRKISY